MKVQGRIISGEFDELMNEFSLETVKHFTTKSTIKESQIKTICEFLRKNQDELDGQIVTLYDQLPVRLTKEETSELLADLDKIKALYQ